MSFRFASDDAGLQVALRRIAQSELGRAVSLLSASGHVPADGIHDIRKSIKKMRGLLRLVRPGFSGFSAENTALRDIGRSLAGRRDADVRLVTFQRLLARTENPDEFDVLRDILTVERDAAHLGATSVDAPREALLAIFQRSHDWKLRGRDHDILIDGLADTRKSTCAAMARADRKRHPVEMHDWRKRAKDHWYQTRLLLPVWPEALQPIADAASQLTEDLGDHHDIGVLTDHLSNLSDGKRTGAAIRQIEALAKAAQQGLEARIFPLGARLYAGNPEAVARLWVNWWHIWR